MLLRKERVWMSDDSYPKQRSTIILITSGFDEDATVICLKRLRQAGVPVKLVGLTRGTVTGEHGLTVRPDLSLESLSQEEESYLIVVPGKTESAKSILADPRFHKMIQALPQQDGLLAIMRSAEAAFIRSGWPGLLSQPYVLLQGKSETARFAGRLVEAAEI